MSGTQLIFGLPALVAVLATPAAAATVSTVPDTVINGSIVDNYNPIVKTRGQAGHYSGETGTLNIDLTPVPSVFVSETKNTLQNVSATGTVTYFFRLNGSGSDPVPLLANIVLETKNTSGFADSNGASVSIRNDTSSTGMSIRDNDKFSGVLHFTATPGDLTSVVVNAHIGYYNDDPIGSTGSAFADPYFSIDPIYAAAHPGLSLTFGAGVGNTPLGGAVPEPATWAMLGIAFAVTGRRLRRRATVRSVAA